MRILILDDDETRLRMFHEKLNDPGDIVMKTRTAKECISELQNYTWDMLFLDHDLGGKVYQESGPETGYEVAKWLFDNPEKKPEKIIVHSFNSSGSKNIIELLPESIYSPGIWLKL